MLVARCDGCRTLARASDAKAGASACPQAVGLACDEFAKDRGKRRATTPGFSLEERKVVFFSSERCAADRHASDASIFAAGTESESS